MKKERWINPPAGGYSTISKKLQSEIAFALKHKQQAILFINRQGMSSFSVCAQCKTVLKCPKCDRAGSFDDRAGGYHRVGGWRITGICLSTAVGKRKFAGGTPFVQ